MSERDWERLRRMVMRRTGNQCESCHTVTHFGLAQIRGLETEALDHLRMVARLTPELAVAHVEAAARAGVGDRML